MSNPIIVCLCGSTRFFEAFQKANLQETLKGHIVLTVGFMMHHLNIVHGGDAGITPDQKRMLDELHIKKIDLANEILCINVNGYIGASTKRELWYANEQGKLIRFWEQTDLSRDEIRRWFLSWNEWVAAAQEASKIPDLNSLASGQSAR